MISVVMTTKIKVCGMQQTANIKEVAHQLIDQLPEDVNWDKLLYAIQVRRDIEAGLTDVKAGRVVSTEQLRKDLGYPYFRR